MKDFFSKKLGEMTFWDLTYRYVVVQFVVGFINFLLK